MGARFYSEFVYIIDQNNALHFVQYYYGANLEGSYRSEIHLADKSYCVEDLYLTDEVETEGEYLPRVKETEWREFWTKGPSPEVEIILAEAGLADIAVSKIVIIYMMDSSRLMLDLGGFVVSAEGVEDFDPDFLDEAVSLARAKTGSVAMQDRVVAEWITEQVRTGNFKG